MSDTKVMLFDIRVTVERHVVSLWPCDARLLGIAFALVVELCIVHLARQAEGCVGVAFNDGVVTVLICDVG